MEKHDESENAQEIIYLILSLFLSIAVFILIAFLFLKGGPGETDDSIRSYSPLFLNGSFGLAPERDERIIYQSGIVFLPLTSVALYLLLGKILKKVKAWQFLIQKTEFHLIAITVLLQIIFWWGAFIYTGALEDGPNGGGQFTRFHPVFFYPVVILIVGVTAVFRKKILLYRNPLVFIFGVLSVILPAVFLYFPEGFLLSEYGLRHNFTPLLGAVSQAVHGRTALVDFQSQYGILYPHFAEFFMRMAGLTVNNLNILFIALTAISWLFIYLAVSEITGYGSIISLITILTVAGFSHPLFEEFNFDNPYLAPYFQYNPIRILWGAVMLWFVIRFLRKKTPLYYITGFALSIPAFLFNLDTGVVVFLSFIAVLCFDSLNDFRSNFKIRIGKTILHLIAGLISILAMVVFYSLFAYIRSGRIPDWPALFTFQSIYYQSGFFMIRMKQVDLWHIPLMIYLITLVVTLIKMVRCQAELTDKYFFYTAIYGVGIFTFFQGRSNILNFFPPIYPAVMLALFYIYSFIKNYDLKIKNLRSLIRTRYFLYELVAVTVLVLILSHGLINYFRYFSPALLSAISNWKVEGKVIDPKIQLGTDYIKSNMKSDKIMIIASDEQYMYLHTGTFGRLPYGSVEDISLVSQAQEVKKILVAGGVEQLFVDPGNKLGEYLLRDQKEYKLKYGILLLPDN